MPGDTLWGVARHYGISVDKLAAANNLTRMSYLRPAQELAIPAEGQIPTPTVPPSEVVHTVQQGERLEDIAERYGIDPERIRAANELAANTWVQPGQVLAIPLNPTPTPTPTMTPTATDTPGPPYPSPQLVYPLDGAEFNGPEEVVMLQWASVGLLKEDEAYAVTLRYRGERPDGALSETIEYTRITSWRVPTEWYPSADAQERRFEWHVDVVRGVAVAEPAVGTPVPGSPQRASKADDVGRGGETECICPPGDVRRFTWN
jgi:LysM repeat protein